MRKTTLLMCILVAGIAAAQMKKAPAPPPGAVTATPRASQQARMDAVRRVTIAEAQKLVANGEAIIVDVRSNTQFVQGHIKGAVNIPGSQILARLNELPARKMIITYCACSAEQTSGRAVLELNQHGVMNAAALKGGWHEWETKKLPTATGSK